MRELTWGQVIGRRFARRSPGSLRTEDEARGDRSRDAVDPGTGACGRRTVPLGAGSRSHAATAVKCPLRKADSGADVGAARDTAPGAGLYEAALWAAAAIGQRPYWETPTWLTEYGLTRRKVTALITAIGGELQGRCLTRSELATAVEGAARLDASAPALRLRPAIAPSRDDREPLLRAAEGRERDVRPRRRVAWRLAAG